MTKKERLDDLFKEWKKKYAKNEIFYKDGIVNESLYRKAPKKILFITKEPNSNKSTNTDDYDFRKWWNRVIELAFSYRIAEWGHGIFHDFPQFKELWEKKDASIIHESLKMIAFMDVKKTGGGGKSKKSVIDFHIERDFNLIHKEIKIINPEIIVTGLSWKSTRDLLFPDVQWKECGYHIKVGKYDNRKVIDFYHPSSRNVPSASYSLLQNVVRSRTFKKL